MIKYMLFSLFFYVNIFGHDFHYNNSSDVKLEINSLHYSDLNTSIKKKVFYATGYFLMNENNGKLGYLKNKEFIENKFANEFLEKNIKEINNFYINYSKSKEHLYNLKKFSHTFYYLFSSDFLEVKTGFNDIFSLSNNFKEEYFIKKITYKKDFPLEILNNINYINKKFSVELIPENIDFSVKEKIKIKEKIKECFDYHITNYIIILLIVFALFILIFMPGLSLLINKQLSSKVINFKYLKISLILINFGMFIITYIFLFLGISFLYFFHLNNYDFTFLTAIGTILLICYYMFTHFTPLNINLIKNIIYLLNICVKNKSLNFYLDTKISENYYSLKNIDFFNEYIRIYKTKNKKQKNNIDEYNIHYEEFFKKNIIF